MDAAHTAAGAPKGRELRALRAVQGLTGLGFMVLERTVIAAVTILPSILSLTVKSKPVHVCMHACMYSERE